MIQEFINMISEQMQSDYAMGVFAGSFMAMISGALIWLVKDVPLKIWKFIWSRVKRLIVYKVTMEDYNSIFYAFEEWMRVNHNKSFRNVEAQFEGQTVIKNSRNEIHIREAPSEKNKSKLIKYGELILRQRQDLHWIWWKGRPIIIDKGREEVQGARESITQYKEVYKLSSWFGKSHINSLLKYIELNTKENYAKRFKPRHYRYSPRHGYWDFKSIIHKRTKETIYYKDLDKIINDIEKFISKKDLYMQYGRPYKMGMLFEGKPRTGKTSIVKMLSHQFERHIYSIELNGFKSDNDLLDAIEEIDKPHKAILLIEDIDSYFDGRKSINGTEVTFSGLLQALDGIGSTNGLITIITTNKKEQIYDEALLGSGRIEKHYHFPTPSKRDVYNYIVKVLGVKTINRKSIKDSINISEVQEAFVESDTKEEFIKKITKHD